MAEIIQGLGDLSAQFLSLSKDMETRVARSMVVSAGNVIKNESKRLAQEQGLQRTGALIKNIAIKREKTSDGVVQYHLGVRHGRAMGRNAKRKYVIDKSGRIGIKYVDDPYYWWFVERGHKIVPRQGSGGVTRYQQRLRNGRLVWRIRKFSGNSLTGRRRSATSSVRPYPFIEPSLQNKRMEAIEAMRLRLEKIIQKANRK